MFHHKGQTKEPFRSIQTFFPLKCVSAVSTGCGRAWCRSHAVKIAPSIPLEQSHRLTEKQLVQLMSFRDDALSMWCRVKQCGRTVKKHEGTSFQKMSKSVSVIVLVFILNLSNFHFNIKDTT